MVKTKHWRHTLLSFLRRLSYLLSTDFILEMISFYDVYPHYLFLDFVDSHVPCCSPAVFLHLTTKKREMMSSGKIRWGGTQRNMRCWQEIPRRSSTLLKQWRRRVNDMRNWVCLSASLFEGVFSLVIALAHVCSQETSTTIIMTMMMLCFFNSASHVILTSCLDFFFVIVFSFWNNNSRDDDVLVRCLDCYDTFPYTVS